MATTRRSAGPALGEFLTALRSRLDALPPEDVSAALVAHAERLPVTGRQAFLDIFPEPHGQPTAPGTPAFGEALRAEELLADIAAFAARAAAGEFAEDDDDWYDRYDRRNDWEDEGGGSSWVEEVDALFAATGEVFICGRLDLAREAYGRLMNVFGNADGDGPLLETWQLEVTDVDEALARHVRAVYETTALQDRAAAVHRAFLALPWCPSPPTLGDVAATRQDGLPDLPAFLPGWIDRLLAETARPSSEYRNRLLAEAAVLHRGIDGLASLAHLPGPHAAGLHLAWIDALAAADRLDEAAAALAGSNPRGWSSPTHPGPVVLPCLWIAATATAPPPADGSHWGQAFSAIDVQSQHSWQLDDLSEDDQTGSDNADDPSTPLTELLTRTILDRPAGPADRQRWLAAAGTTVEERVDAVVSNKHRKAYARVASVAVAHAEALAVTGRASDGHAYLTGIREKYPRHTAFRSELDTAIHSSTLISNQWPDRSTGVRTTRRPGRWST